MSEAMKKHPIRVQIGVKRPKIYLVPNETAQSVAQLLKTFEVSEHDETIDADLVFEDLTQKFGKVGATIRGYRARENMTQVELAKRIQVTQGDISAMENSRRAVGKKLAAKLAKIFQTDYRVFL